MPGAPPPTPKIPGTSRASFFPNLDHSYVAQAEPNPDITAGEHAYCAQPEPKQAEPNPKIKTGPTRVAAPLLSYSNVVDRNHISFNIINLIKKKMV